MVEPIKAKVEPISFKFELNNMDRAISFPPGSLLLLLSQNSVFRKIWERRLFGNLIRNSQDFRELRFQNSIFFPKSLHLNFLDEYPAPK